MASDTPYTRFAKFYDAYVGEYARDLPLYLTLASKAHSPILEIGCGSGRVVLPLLRAGRTVTGVDISNEMLQLAEEKLKKNHLDGKCTLLNHNFVERALPRTYGLALVTFYTYNYLLSPEDQKAFLDHVAETLLPGSIIALHLFYPHPLHHPETAGKWVDKGSYQVAGETVLLQDFRCMLNEHLEERIQAFISESGQREEIKTLRRYVRPADMHRLLLDSGFEKPILIDDFDQQKETLLTLDTVITKEYVIMAQKQ